MKRAISRSTCSLISTGIEEPGAAGLLAGGLTSSPTLAAAQEGGFVANDCRLEEADVAAGAGGRIWLVTGPNMAGKSTFLSVVTAARPKVADYPFTTLSPHLGIVEVADYRRLVVADIPGLIEGAAEGTGLGIQFLKHLQRTRLLLHLVDLAPLALDVDPVEQVRQLEQEMQKFDAGLMEKPRWLVFTKADLMPPGEAEELRVEELAVLGGNTLGDILQLISVGQAVVINNEQFLQFIGQLY